MVLQNEAKDFCSSVMMLVDMYPLTNFDIEQLYDFQQIAIKYLTYLILNKWKPYNDLTLVLLSS